MNLSTNKGPTAVSENLVTQAIGDELLVYNLQTHRAMSLNSTVACVWELCDGRNSLSEIGALAQGKLKVSLSAEAVSLAIDELQKNSLLADDYWLEAKEPLSAMSRRSLIKKVGMSAAVAIPVITAVTAPRAAAAASSNLLPDGRACNVDGECQNDCCFGNVCQPIAVCFGP